MNDKKNTKRQYAICIKSEDPDLLTPRMIYLVLPDDSAAKSNYVRVIDNEGEDYLYPASYFILVSFPQVIDQALAEMVWPGQEKDTIRAAISPSVR